MTVQEFYEYIGADYSDVSHRFKNDSSIARFVKMFPVDPSYDRLCSALESEDADTAFRAAHTLKGVSLNLGFSALYEAAFDMAEALRGGLLDGSDELIIPLRERYSRVMDGISQL